MKKIKLFLGVALFGAMTFGAFTTYDYYTMSANERALLENVEALTNDEPGGGGGGGIVILEKGQSAIYPNSANRFWGDGCKEEKGSTCIIRNDSCSGGMSLDVITSIIGIAVSILACL